MFEFLRRRLQPAPALRAPLRAAAWDGQALRLACGTGLASLALDVDGAYFGSVPIEDGRTGFEFPFSPSGRAEFAVLPRAGRDGDALAAQPLRLCIGRPGIGRASATPAALATLAGPARRVPFGVDVAAREVAIIVPVYGAAALVERCLGSVLAHTRGRARLIIIDDASPDAEITPLLASHAHLPGVTVLANSRNLGFTATVNRGLAEARDADVVLLNADADVGPGWLTGLRRAACSADDVGTVTAVSDNAGAFSVPELEQANALPPAWSFEDAARALWQQAGLVYPELPTGNGFCLYIRREVLAVIGGFDAVAFPEGYGEENDFCQRAARHGFRHLVAGNVLVRHARSASFGEERRRRLGTAGMAVLRQRWPGYEREVGRALFSFERRVLDWRVRRLFAAAHPANAPKPRLLWVGEGAPAWPDAEVWTLRARGSENELLVDGVVVAANTWHADDPEPSYRALWDWLQVFAFERLIVAERKEAVAQILCRLLDIPLGVVDPRAPSAALALAAAASAASFPERPQ
ncbi:MAG: glycosyltransferase [Xanthomonadales bacterium]|nr:glycosyltransferase [Xanthomonadales bacterium]